MDANRFDSISRLLAARRLSRRQALVKGGAGLAAAGLAAAGVAAVSAQDATPEADTTQATDAALPEFLFVQSFESGTIEPAGQEGRYTVSLAHGLGQTIYFADRPDRTVGALPTDKFLDYIGFPADNPPNAALVLHQGQGETDIAVVELFDPVYDAATANATYTVAVLAEGEKLSGLSFTETNEDLATLAPSFGAAHLFIDGISDCPDGAISCYSTLPGSGTMGYCAIDGNAGACGPCESHDPSYWYQQCNATYTGCNGNCFVWDFCSRDSFYSSNTYCKNSTAGGTWIGW
jgi:hypothetical protein